MVLDQGHDLSVRRERAYRSDRSRRRDTPAEGELARLVLRQVATRERARHGIAQREQRAVQRALLGEPREVRRRRQLEPADAGATQRGEMPTAAQRGTEVPGQRTD